MDIYFTMILNQANYTLPFQSLKSKKTKYLMWLCLINNIEGFSNQVTKTSCIDEALTLHACKLSLPSFVNPLRTSFLYLYLIRIMK